MGDLQSRYQPGHVPGNDFVDAGAPYGIKLGIITRVDEVELKCDVRIITGGSDRYEIDLTQAMTGPRSFWGGIPEVNSHVIIGYRRRHKQLHEAVILGYVPNGKRSAMRFDPMAASDPAAIAPEDAELYRTLFSSQTRYKSLKLAPGDVGGMSAAGAELQLSADVRAMNRAGDFVELRDAERTLVSQALHRVDSEAGVIRLSGAARRSGFYLPQDIFSDGRTLKGESDKYFGASVVRRMTPDGASVYECFNDEAKFPSVTFGNGRRAHYPSTLNAVNFEDPESGAGAEPYTEHRLEMFHTTDLVQEVREEIDGFQMDRRPLYIEQVFGTVVGNDTSSEDGLRQYGQLLRPKLFPDFLATGPATFSMEPIKRTPLDDSEAYTTAAAYLFRLTPPTNPAGKPETISACAMAVSKQGKLFVNLPGSKVEKYNSGTKNVSAEINMEGALKMRLGASTPDNIAMHLTLEGGAIFDFRGSSSGAGLAFRTHSSYVVEAQGVPDNNNLAYSENLQGTRASYCSADSTEQIAGGKVTNVGGGYSILADRVSIAAQSGLGLNAGAIDVLCAGKSQYRYAQKVDETVVTGGKTSTVLSGGVTENLVVGDKSTNVLGGSVTTLVPAGGYTLTVGSGGVTITSTAGGVNLTSATGSVAMTAGLGMNLTAGSTMSLTAPTGITLSAAQVLVGGASASLGVVRGLPSLPIGSPSLCPVTGTPLFGSALIRSV